MKKSILLSIALLAHSMSAACPTCGGKKKKHQQTHQQEQQYTSHVQQQVMSRQLRPRMAPPARDSSEQDLYNLEARDEESND